MHAVLIKVSNDIEIFLIPLINTGMNGIIFVLVYRYLRLFFLSHTGEFFLFLKRFTGIPV